MEDKNIMEQYCNSMHEKTLIRTDDFIKKSIGKLVILPRFIIKHLVTLDIADTNCEFNISKKYTLRIKYIGYLGYNDIFYDIF